MDAIYVMKTLAPAEEYICPAGNVRPYRLPAMKAELQFLDQSELRLEVSMDGGTEEVPDALVYDGLLFLSDNMKQILDEYRVDYVFYKKTTIASDSLGIWETFWLTVPPRIDCLDTERSRFEKDWDFEDGLIPQLRAEKVVIDPSRLGRYQIFRIAGLLDDNVYLTEELYQRLNGKGLEGVTYFFLQ